jgi:hypothetical protein
LRGIGQGKRRDQPFRIDRVGQRLKQFERAESPSEQLQPVTIGREYAQDGRPLLGNLSEQLEPGTILEAFAGNDDFEGVRTQQIQAVALVRDGVDRIEIAKRSGDRLVAGGILVDDEHTHAGKLPAWLGFGLSGRSRFPYSGRIHSVVHDRQSADTTCMGHIRDAAQPAHDPRELFQIGDRYGNQDVGRACLPIGRRGHSLDAEPLQCQDVGHIPYEPTAVDCMDGDLHDQS